jgi:cytochrome c
MNMKALIAAISATALIVISGAARADDPVALVKSFGGDCLSCHSIEKKIVGPAWKDVSAKYKGDAGAKAALVEKVIKGGKGNWDKVTGGQSMTPHPTKPSKEEIEKIVAAILTL